MRPAVPEPICSGTTWGQSATPAPAITAWGSLPAGCTQGSQSSPWSLWRGPVRPQAQPALCPAWSRWGGTTRCQSPREPSRCPGPAHTARVPEPQRRPHQTVTTRASARGALPVQGAVTRQHGSSRWGQRRHPAPWGDRHPHPHFSEEPRPQSRTLAPTRGHSLSPCLAGHRARQQHCPRCSPCSGPWAGEAPGDVRPAQCQGRPRPRAVTAVTGAGGWPGEASRLHTRPSRWAGVGS